MTDYLPPNLLALFAARDPIPFLPPIDKHATHRKLPYTGIAQFLGEFERKEKQEQANYKLEQDLALWNPKKNPNATNNPYNTMFIARLIIMTKNINTGKPRGYAFVEFDHERDMHAAVKSLNGRKIDGVRVVTDIERGRTRADWRPKRLGKGLGKTRQGPPEKSSRSTDKPDNGGYDNYSSSGRGGRPFSRDFDSRNRYSSGRPQRSRSRSRDRYHRRDRSRSRDRYRNSGGGRDRNYKRDRPPPPRREGGYGEYGAEIQAEYGGGGGDW